jgi:hypothetical protein
VSPDITDMASVVREADERTYEDRKERDRGTASDRAPSKA